MADVSIRRLLRSDGDRKVSSANLHDFSEVVSFRFLKTFMSKHLR